MIAKLERTLSTVLNYKTRIKTEIVIENDQDKPQSQIANKPIAPQGRATQQSRDTRKTN